MNKRVFIGATLVTATVVGGVVYYRHKILEQLDKWLDDEHQPADVWREAMDLSPEEADEFQAAVKKYTS